MDSTNEISQQPLKFICVGVLFALMIMLAAQHEHGLIFCNLTLFLLMNQDDWEGFVKFPEDDLQEVQLSYQPDRIIQPRPSTPLFKPKCAGRSRKNSVILPKHDQKAHVNKSFTNRRKLSEDARLSNPKLSISKTKEHFGIQVPLFGFPEAPQKTNSTLIYRKEHCADANSQITQLMMLKQETVKSSRRRSTQLERLFSNEIKGYLEFSSAFECGNLLYAFQKTESWMGRKSAQILHYELHIRPDTNSRGHRQWFYFAVRANATKSIRFHILPFRKKYSLFAQGMRPYASKDQIRWQSVGQDVVYGLNFASYGSINSSSSPQYVLSFTCDFKQGEELYIASCVPYSYSFLEKNIAQVISKNERCQRFVLCRTLNGLEVPLLKIIPLNSSINRYIIILARTHPGETSASWVMEGIMSSLRSIQEVLDKTNLTLLLLPMVNPDGVVLGNYRTGVMGTDFNRQFQSAQSDLYPEISSIRRLVQQCKSDGNVELLLDLHGHSSRKGCFIYGPSEELFRNHPCKNLQTIIAQNSEYFEVKNCQTCCDTSIYETARVFFQRKQEIFSLTCENSLGLYENAQKANKQLFPTDWQQFGLDLITSILHIYSNGFEQNEEISNLSVSEINGQQFVWQRSKTEDKSVEEQILRQIKLDKSLIQLSKSTVLKQELRAKSDLSLNDEDSVEEDLSERNRIQLITLVRREILQQSKANQDSLQAPGLSRIKRGQYETRKMTQESYRPRQKTLHRKAEGMNNFKLYRFGVEDGTLEEWEKQKRLLSAPRMIVNEGLANKSSFLIRRSTRAQMPFQIKSVSSHKNEKIEPY